MVDDHGCLWMWCLDGIHAKRSVKQPNIEDMVKTIIKKCDLDTWKEGGPTLTRLELRSLHNTIYSDFEKYLLENWIKYDVNFSSSIDQEENR